MNTDKESKSARDNWRIAGDQKILWRFWDGDYVVYSSLSGRTHVLDIISGKVLTLIMDRPSSLYEIRSEIADYMVVPNDAELATAIMSIFERLANIGLVELEA